MYAVLGYTFHYFHPQIHTCFQREMLILEAKIWTLWRFGNEKLTETDVSRTFVVMEVFILSWCL